MRGQPPPANFHSNRGGSQQAPSALLSPHIHDALPQELRQLTKSGCWTGCGRFCPSLQNSLGSRLHSCVSVKESHMFSVIDSQPEELLQLLVVCVNEVSRFLPAVVLQFGVGTQREKVAGKKAINPCLLKGVKSCWFATLANMLCQLRPTSYTLKEIISRIVSCCNSYIVSL